MKKARRFVLTILLGSALAAGSSLATVQNHSFDVVAGSETVCTDGAIFDGQATAASALNILMTSEVWDAGGTTLLATGNSHTFTTTVSETVTFTVMGTFTAGATVRLVVNNSPGTFIGLEGDALTATVADCTLPMAPATPGWALALLAALVAAGGAWIASRGGLGNLPGGAGGRAALAALVLLGTAAAASAQPTFTKVFSPDTIGLGSTTTLTFTIANNSASGVTDLAFSDPLPAGTTIATPPLASTTCGAGQATLTAPAGGSTISLAGGTVGAGKSCTVKVNITGTAIGTHMNVSGTLTSSAGSSGTAADDLIVEDDRPGFSKSFSPPTVPVGGRSTLTFLIDNTANTGETANAGDVTSLDFDDVLPPGMVIAGPSNIGTTCGGTFISLTAPPGGTTIEYNALGSAFDGSEVVVGGATCTVVVDVVANVAGALHNLTSDLIGTVHPSASVNSGRATATLVSTATALGIRKSFLDDPVPPGGTVTLEFRIDNRNRDFTATGIGFTDDLDFTPSTGITFDSGPFPDPPCGAGSTLTLAAGDVLTLAGGTLAPGAFCKFSVTLGVPATEAPGAYVNTTSAVTGTIDGGGVVGNVASDTLFVDVLPIFTKTFTDDPVGAGGTVTLEFFIKNTDPTSTLTDIAFNDDLESAILGLEANSLVDMGMPDPIVDPCGAGSELTVASLTIGPTTFVFPSMLEFTGGSLAEAGMPGDSCTFSVVLDVPVVPGGIYTNTTDPLFADLGATPIVRDGTSGDLEVLGAPRLTKNFLGGPVEPGELVTLEFQLTHSPGSPADATGTTFTDDLAGSTGITGLKAAPGELPLTGLCSLGDGTLAGSAGDTLLTFSGATLAPGEVCTFSLLVEVPAGAPGGTFTNTTSGVGATVDGIATTSRSAKADLVVAQVAFSKSFTDDPALPGGTVTLAFTLVNLSPFVADAITFTDDLGAVIAGLLPAAGELPQVDPCGAGSSLVPFDPPGAPPPDPSILDLIGGALAPAGSVGDACTISVVLDIPGGADEGSFPNLTSVLTFDLDGTFTTLPGASDLLTVDSDLLFLTKEFIDDPVVPGGTVTLRFSIANLDPDDPISMIAFSDDLDAALTGLAATGLPVAGCGGNATTADGGMTIDFAGGSLAAGGSCFFDVSVSVPPGLPTGPVVNTTTSISGELGGLPVSGGPASDTLQIGNLLFTKAFDGPSVRGGTPILTFTITNLSGTESVSGLSFSDNLEATLTGLVATGLPAVPCGAGSTITGTSLLAFSGGTLPPLGVCSFDVDLSVPVGAAVGTHPNTTTELTVSGLPVADPATDDLEIEPPPAFAKAFSPDAIGQGFTTTLTFTIDNAASALAATGLAFSDLLPIGLEVAAAPMVTNTCDGSVVADAGSVSISLSGGSVGAGLSCTVSVKVTAVGSGVLVNTTGDLTSSSGNSGTATDTLTVAACTALNGANLTLENDVVVVPEFYQVCNTIQIKQHYLVLGPDGVLDLTAGVAVIIFNGVEFATDSEVTITLDPSLIP